MPPENTEAYERAQDAARRAATAIVVMLGDYLRSPGVRGLIAAYLRDEFYAFARQVADDIRPQDE